MPQAQGIVRSGYRQGVTQYDAVGLRSTSHTRVRDHSGTVGDEVDVFLGRIRTTTRRIQSEDHPKTDERGGHEVVFTPNLLSTWYSAYGAIRHDLPMSLAFSLCPSLSPHCQTHIAVLFGGNDRMRWRGRL